MEDQIMPQNTFLRNSEDDDTSLETDPAAAYYLRRRLGVSLAHARVIAELLTGGGES
jgi:hypothetical protein